MKSLLDRFLKAPYGFVEPDVQWLVAKLFKDGEISLFVNSEQVTLLSKSEEEIIRYLTRKEYNDKLMTDKKVKANEKQKKSVREVMKELFGITPSSDDDDSIMKSFLGYANNLKNELEKLDVKYQFEPKYPGKKLVSTGKQLMTSLTQIKYSTEFFNKVDKSKDDYLDFADDYEPLKKFFAGAQKDHFDTALKLMAIYDESKTFIVNKAIEDAVRSIKAVLEKENPYSDIFRLPGLCDDFRTSYGKLLEDMAGPIELAVKDARKRVFDDLSTKKCKDLLTGKFTRLFDDLSTKAKTCNNVATLQNIKIEADALKIRCLDEIAIEEAKFASKTGDGTVTSTKKNKTISIKSINTSSTWQLETEDDVRKYIEELQRKLMNTLEEDTVVNIEF